MWVKRRHKIVYILLKPFFALVLRLKFGYKAKKYKLEKKPYLILSNHQTSLDPFNIAVSFRRNIYYMASIDLFVNKFTGGIISYLVAPIPKEKSNADITAIKNCVRVIKEGGTICLFPEGNRTYSGTQCYIDPAISKLIKLLKVPVILYNIQGGYGVEPRWASNVRKGKSHGYIREVLEVDEVQAMSNEDLYERVKSSLNVIEAPSKNKYKSKKRAEKLERVLYLCPTCGHTDGIYSEGNKVKCHHCGLEVEYHSDLTFNMGLFKTVNDWYKYQEEYIDKYEFQNDEVIFKDDDVKLYDVSKGGKKVLIGFGDISIKQDRFILSKHDNSYAIFLKSIGAMTVVGKNKLNFYVNNQTFQIKGGKHLNVLKYMQIYYKIKGENNELFRL